MFLIDKYEPKDINDIYFHKNIYERLEKMSKDNSIPHIIFHGPSGGGKKTMTKIFLRMIYGKGVDNLYTLNEDITGSSNKIKKEEFQKSEHHIIIKPTGTNFDRYIVHQVIKKYANTKTFELSLNPNSKFRTIQISNLDKLSHSAQTSLRRMIETNASTCRFIMWCDNLSNVILPLQSRCILVRVPRPTEKELFGYLFLTKVKENKMVKLEILRKIVKNSECDIKKALWNLELDNLGFDLKTNMDFAIEEIVSKIMKKKISLIEKIRDKFFHLTITNYEPIYIIKKILNNILSKKNISEKSKINIILKTSEIEHKIIRGRRDIIHFDDWVTTIIKNLHYT